MAKVLIVEDEEDLCSLIASQIRSDQTEVTECHTAEAGLEAALKEDFNLVISDIRLPGIDGIEMMKKITTEKSPAPAFFIMSGYSDYSTDEILAAGGKDFFSKPNEITRLFAAVKELLESL